MTQVTKAVETAEAVAVAAKKEARKAEREARKAAEKATNPVVANQRKKEKVINADLHRTQQTVPVKVSEPKQKDKKSKRRYGPLEYEADLIARPFDMDGCVSKISFNPAPTLKCSPARTTFLQIATPVAMDKCLQIVVFPGHGAPVPTFQSSGTLATSMDAVAFHSRSGITDGGGIACPIGPFRMYDPNTSSTKNAATAFMTNGLVVGTCTNGTAGMTPLYYDEQLPYAPLDITTINTAAHVRWRLVSWGVKIQNMTYGGIRGGSVCTVNFENSSGLVTTLGGAATNQSQLKHNTSFRVHDIDDEKQSVTHVGVPRTQDMAYWHSIPFNNPYGTGMLQNDWSGAAAAIFINAPNATQEYVLDFVFNWQLAGTNMNSVSTPVVPENGLKPAVEQVISALHSTASSGTLAPVVATAVPDNPLRESFGERLVRGAYNGFHDLAHSAGKMAVDTMVNRFVSSMEKSSLTPRSSKWLEL